MIDLKKLIYDLDTITDSNDKRIGDARRVCKMWKELKDSWHIKDMHLIPPHQLGAISNVIDFLENKHFPTKMRQTVTIEIERKSESLLEDTIDQIRLVSGVKDVRPHDSRY